MRLLLPALMLAAAPATARDPILSLPVDCTLGDDCFILQYADADPGRGAADYTCGPMSYDGHKGTDFAVPSFAAMAEGVDVIAAAGMSPARRCRWRSSPGWVVASTNAPVSPGLATRGWPTAAWPADAALDRGCETTRGTCREPCRRRLCPSRP